MIPGIEGAGGAPGQTSVLLLRIRASYQLANPSCLIRFTGENLGWEDKAGQPAAINASQVFYYHWVCLSRRPEGMFQFGLFLMFWGIFWTMNIYLIQARGDSTSSISGRTNS